MVDAHRILEAGCVGSTTHDVFWMNAAVDP
jgi:hypothetical protein